MTTPRVTELPRRLEPICSDTFLSAREDEAPAPRKLAAVRESRPLGVVLQLRPRDPLTPSRPAKARRRNRRPPHVRSDPGPGGDAA